MPIVLRNSPSLDAAIAEALAPDELTELMFLWGFWARREQWPPPGDWVTWLLMGGRGAGKTRAGAEWVRGLATEGIGPIALVGETIAEAIAVMVEGPSGIMAVTPPDERPKLSGATLHWKNGVDAMVLGAADPERFRGPQFAAAWCDAVALDVVPSPIDWSDLGRFRALAAIVKAEAAARNIPIAWGGDWVGLRDMPHYELDPWRAFAAKAKPFAG